MIIVQTEIASGELHRETPLHLAATLGANDIIQILLDFKANVDVLDSFKCTPLMAAVCSNHVEAAALLLKNHANVDYNNEGYTAIAYAIMSSYDKMVELLIKHNACVNFTQSQITELLICAARHHDSKITKLVWQETYLSNKYRHVNATSLIDYFKEEEEEFSGFLKKNNIPEIPLNYFKNLPLTYIELIRFLQVIGSFVAWDYIQNNRKGEVISPQKFFNCLVVYRGAVNKAACTILPSEIIEEISQYNYIDSASLHSFRLQLERRIENNTRSL